MPAIDFRKQRDFGQLFEVTFAFIRENWSALGKALLYLVFPVIVLSTLLMTQPITNYFTFYIEFLSDIERIPDIDEFINGFSWLSLLGGIIGLLLSSLLLSTVTYATLILYKEDKSLNVNDVWEKVKEILPNVLVTTLGGGGLLMVTLLVSIVIFIIPCLGVLAWYILVFCGSAIYLLLFPIRLEENLGVFDSISRAISLVKNRFWITVGIIIVLQIITSILQFIFIIPIILLVVFGGIIDVAEGSFLAKIGMFLVALFMLASTFLNVIPLIAFYFYYFSLVEEKEGAGLMERIENISTTQDES